MLSYDSPAVLNMLNDVSAGMGGISMGITMSGLGMSSLGISASSMGRADEAQRSHRLQSILRTVAAKPGRVSEEGLLALCKSLGVECEVHPDEGAWSLLIGDELLCDVTFKNDEIAAVNLQANLDESKPDLQFGPTGARILLNSLRPLPGQNKINNTLDRFSENLEKLNTLSRLGNGVSCYNAIAGVYTSLRKLFEYEKSVELAARQPDERYRTQKAEREVLCRRSGRPRMNGGSCLGLSLEYWMDRRHLIPKNASTQLDKGKGNADECPTIEDGEVENEGIYSLTIECEASSSTLYTPIRVSDDWISDSVEKRIDDNDAHASVDNILLERPSIDWLEPKPTYLEASAQADDAMMIDSAGRLPDIRFVARLHPPLVVPIAVHMQLSQIVGIQPRAEDFKPETFVGLALRPGEEDPGSLATTGESTHEIRSSRSVLVVDEQGKEKFRQHDMSLYVPKMEYSRALESLPFSHPKQLVEILPTLRQYAFTTSLMRDAFYEPKPPPHNQTTLSPPLTPPHHPPTNSTTEPALQLDINLSYTPPPRFTLLIPHPCTPAAPATATAAHPKPSPTNHPSSLLASLLSTPTTPYLAPLSLTLDVHPNADLVIADQNLLAAAAAAADKDDHIASTHGDADVDVNMMDAAVRAEEDGVKRLARALHVCGDLGVWAEWLRREVGRGGGGGGGGV